MDKQFDLLLENDSMDHKLIRIVNQCEFQKINRTKFSSLTNREIEIIKLVASGNNNPKIASILFISRFTVEQHRKNINRKLQTKSLPHLIQYALAFDLL